MHETTSQPVTTIPSQPAGKSECTRCSSANGRFCRACLLVRYGTPLETVRKQMAAGAWLCPHCYEDDHPDEVPPYCIGGLFGHNFHSGCRMVSMQCHVSAQC